MNNAARMVASIFVVAAVTLSPRISGAFGSADEGGAEAGVENSEIAAKSVIERVADYAQDDNTIKRTFSVRPGGLLIIESDRGSVNVEAGDSDELEIVIEREVVRGDEEEVLQLMKFEFEQDGNTIRLIGDYENAGRKRDRNRLRIKILARVPTSFNVDLRTAGGSISVADLEGEVKTNTSGGSLRLGNITGSVYGRTSGGSVELVGSSGKADIKTSGGSIRIGHVDAEVDVQTSGGSITVDHAAGYISAETSGGSITVREVKGAIDARTTGGSVTAYISEQPTADCALSTTGGRVKVQLAPNVAVNLEADASGGTVDTDVPVRVLSKRGRGHVEGTINGGGPTLKLSASGGGVTVSTLR